MAKLIKTQTPTSNKISRFTLISLLAILCNDTINWVTVRVLHPLVARRFLRDHADSPSLQMNPSRRGIPLRVPSSRTSVSEGTRKGMPLQDRGRFLSEWMRSVKITKSIAAIGTLAISYFGMLPWVFVRRPHNNEGKSEKLSASGASSSTTGIEEWTGTSGEMGLRIQAKERKMKIAYSLSVIMPAHNEEVAIADTVHSAIAAVSTWTQDFEILVVNDGSRDRTQAILEGIAIEEPRVHVIHHDVNQGYGAALVSGFEAASKDLVFFMDSDGQFDICDLERFFPLIDTYDAVLGYRVHRQDTWLRKLNAWGWKVLVRLVFKLRVRDIDCAFKLYRGQFFRDHRLETRGAMINTEILYKFKRAGYTYTEVGVHHLPRKGGRATGAKPAVIARAFREMFVYAWKWHREEQME